MVLEFLANGTITADDIHDALLSLSSGFWLNFRDGDGRAQGKIVWLVPEFAPCRVVAWEIVGIIPLVTNDAPFVLGQYAFAARVVIEATSSTHAETFIGVHPWYDDKAVENVSKSIPTPVSKRVLLTM